MTLRLCLLPSDIDGYTLWPHNHTPTRIVLNVSRDEAGLACALAHEVKHLEHASPPGSADRADERTVRRAVAAWLLPDVEAACLAFHENGLAAAAAGFGVTPAVLMDRVTLLDAEDAAGVQRAELARAADVPYPWG